MGVLSTFRDSVTLINRTSRKLNVRYDGEDITLQPGENPGFPKIAVQYAKNQNPLKGSKHPVDPRQFVCLVGVKDSKDPVTPISDETMAIADGKLEVVDRSGEFHGEPMRQVKLLKKTPYSAYEAAVELPGNYDVNKSIE
jgi:hypothetical protein